MKKRMMIHSGLTVIFFLMTAILFFNDYLLLTSIFAMVFGWAGRVLLKYYFPQESYVYPSIHG